MPIITHRIFGRFTAALLSALLAAVVASPASAQQCTTDSTDNRGCAVIVAGPSVIEAERQEEERRRASLNMPAGPARPAPHSAIAFHPDAADYWIAAMYPNAFSALEAARESCNAMMGGGCEATWQGTGYIGAARTANGEIYWITDQNKGKIQKQMADWCKPFELGCIDTAIFHSNSEFRRNRSRTGHNIRFPKDTAALRKRYAALAWISEGVHHGEVWVASGYPSLQASQDTALNLCRAKLTRGQTCGIASSTGNGVIAIFLFATGEQRTMVEQNEARVRQAVAQYCRRQKQKCTIRHIYDARTAGTFAHVYKTGGE